MVLVTEGVWDAVWVAVVELVTVLEDVFVMVELLVCVEEGV